MLSAFANCFKITELRQRIIFTLCVIVAVRIGAAIPCPGINTEILARYFKNVMEKDPNKYTVVGLFNLFSGGALENCAVFTLGIIPYISASIMLQFMTAVVPSLSKLAREEGGRQKITQYTRYATIRSASCRVIFTPSSSRTRTRRPLFRHRRYHRPVRATRALSRAGL